uniref:Uncharacterized protein n=1 Tax=Populus trichocarpa TaxID=3694 RepID=A0A2K1WQG6_POPTR
MNGGRQWWGGFDALYDQYSDRMLFDWMSLEEPDETEHLQQVQNDPYQDIETAYKISCQPENPACYNHSAELFQQFQVLLQRFLENEPLEQEFMLVQGMPCVNCSRFPMQKVYTEEIESDYVVLAPDLLKIIESSILNSHLFLKMIKEWKKKCWPQTYNDVQLLFSLVHIKILSTVLRMVRISKEQIRWCEEKMKKINLPNGRLQRDPSPILFPC